jgi:hypothetical protein
VSGHDIDLDAIDPSGAVAEAAHRVSRRAFLAGAAGAAAVAAGLPAATLAKESRQTDIDILNFALTLEYLQAAFYTEAERLKALGPVGAEAAKEIGAVERAHVTALQHALGPAATHGPLFDFRGATEDDDTFLRTAVAFEDLGTAAYKQQLTRITTPAYISAAASIHTVEARHAAWIRYIAGVQPAVAALDDPISDSEAKRLVAGTGFTRPRPVTTSRSAPPFTG